MKKWVRRTAAVLLLAVLALLTRDAHCAVIDRNDPESAWFSDLFSQPWEKLYCITCQDSGLDRETRQVGYFVDENGRVLSGGILIPAIF